MVQVKAVYQITTHIIKSRFPALSRHALRPSPLPSCTRGILTINQMVRERHNQNDGLAHPGVVRSHTNPRR